MKSLRQIIVVLLLLFLGAGTALIPLQATEVIQPAVETSVDQLMPNDSGKCGACDMAIAASPCVIMGACGQVLVLTGELVTLRVESLAYSHPALSRSSFQDSPEPFPPQT